MALGLELWWFSVALENTLMARLRLWFSSWNRVGLGRGTYRAIQKSEHNDDADRVFRGEEALLEPFFEAIAKSPKLVIYGESAC